MDDINNHVNMPMFDIKIEPETIEEEPPNDEEYWSPPPWETTSTVQQTSVWLPSHYEPTQTEDDITIKIEPPDSEEPVQLEPVYLEHIKTETDEDTVLFWPSLPYQAFQLTTFELQPEFSDSFMVSGVLREANIPPLMEQVIKKPRGRPKNVTKGPTQFLKVKSNSFLFSKLGRSRRKRCKKCAGCLRPLCGVCTHCKNMTRFGGAGTMKQTCVRRSCLLVPKGERIVNPVSRTEDQEKIAGDMKLFQPCMVMLNKNDVSDYLAMLAASEKSTNVDTKPPQVSLSEIEEPIRNNKRKVIEDSCDEIIKKSDTTSNKKIKVSSRFSVKSVDNSSPINNVTVPTPFYLANDSADKISRKPTTSDIPSEKCNHITKKVKRKCTLPPPSDETSPQLNGVSPPIEKEVKECSSKIISKKAHHNKVKAFTPKSKITEKEDNLEQTSSPVTTSKKHTPKINGKSIKQQKKRLRRFLQRAPKCKISPKVEPPQNDPVLYLPAHLIDHEYCDIPKNPFFSYFSIYYTCPLCQLSTRSIPNLKQHGKAVHETQLEITPELERSANVHYQCNMCITTSANVNTLYQHRSVIHKTYNSKLRKHCALKCMSKDEKVLKPVTTIKKKKINYNCQICNRKFKTKKIKHKHVFWRHIKPCILNKYSCIKYRFSMYCDVCNCGFDSRCSFIKHYKEYHIAKISSVPSEIKHYPSEIQGFSDIYLVDDIFSTVSEISVNDNKEIYQLNSESITKYIKNDHDYLLPDIELATNSELIRSSKARYQMKIKSDGNFNCKICNNYFNDPFKLILHRKTHLNDFNYLEIISNICNLCCEIFRNQTDFKYHMLGEHNYIIPKRKSTRYKCKLCLVIFKLPAHFYVHQYMHYYIAMYQKYNVCECSELQYTSKAQLLQHIELLHLKNSETTCKICLEKFKTLHELSSHVITRHGTKIIVCNVCNVECNLDVYVTMHAKCYVNNKCVFCEKLNVDEAHLRAHVNNVIFKYYCVYCKNLYLDQASINCHLKNQHRLICDVCSVVCETKIKLRSHMMELHLPPTELIQCSECDIFIARNKFKKHVLLVHDHLIQQFSKLYGF